MKFAVRIILGFVILPVFFIHAGLAQEDEGTESDVTLDKREKENVNKDHVKKEIKLGDIVVTAAKHKQSVKDIPGSISVITSDDIGYTNLPNGDIGDVLRSAAGITLRRAYAPFPAYPNIRGVGSDATVILINGIPTNWEITQAVPPGNIERIEVLRGPSSALYGANASGGVVNIITKEGGGKHKNSVSGGYGSFRTQSFNVSSIGGVKNLYYSIAVTHKKSDGAKIVKNNIIPSITMIDGCKYNKWGAVLNMTYHVDNDSKISFLYNLFTNEYTRGRPNHGGNWERLFTSLIYDQRLTKMFDLKASIGCRYDDLLHRYDMGGVDYSPKMKRYSDYYETPIELQLTGYVGFGNTITTGLFYNDQATDQDYYSSSANELIKEDEYKVRTIAGYLQDVWKPIRSLIITAGIRYDHWENYDNYFSSFIDDQPKNSTHDNWSPKVGIRYNFMNFVSIWTNFAIGYKPPSPDQLYKDSTDGGIPREPNPDLKPEKTYSYELGLDGGVGKLVQAKVVGFYNYTDDKILSWYSADNVWINRNIGRTKSYGGELELKIHLFEQWLVNANYTLNSTKIDKNPSNPEQEGNWMPFCPEHKVNAGITFVLENILTLSGFARYISLQHTNDDNIKYTDDGEDKYMTSSFVMDLKGILSLPSNWTSFSNIDILFGVDNLFDEEYRTYYIYEDPGRVYYCELKMIF